MKRMRCWRWTAALWLAAGSLLMGGCGADENPAQEGTGGAGQMIEADTAVSQEETELRQNMEEAAISFPWVMVVSGAVSYTHLDPGFVRYGGRLQIPGRV